jgi:hypothetical protein
MTCYFSFVWKICYIIYPIDILLFVYIIQIKQSLTFWCKFHVSKILNFSLCKSMDKEKYETTAF